MLHSFQNILIPVDLSVNTSVAIAKGMQLADVGTSIHLLYVNDQGLMSMAASAKKYLLHSEDSDCYGSIVQNLEKWKYQIEESDPRISVSIWTATEDSIHRAIEKKAMQLSADLIIIGKHSTHSWFPFLNSVFPLRIADATGIPILTVKPGGTPCDMRSVVIPIDSVTNRSKLDIISTISRKFKVNIHLAAIMNADKTLKDSVASSLLQIYQLLKNSGRHPVNYVVLCGRNKSIALADYAQKNNADILLVSPGSANK